MGRFDPAFDMERHADRYFCTGVMAARRGIFDLDWYLQLLHLSQNVPSFNTSAAPELKPLFYFGEMGLLNYMICKSIDQRRLKVASRAIQHIVPDFRREETARRFSIVDGMPQVVERRVLHFCGGCKPYNLNPLGYSEPMTHFRRQHGRAIHPELSEPELDARIRAEDRAYLDRLSGGLKGKLRRLAIGVLGEYVGLSAIGIYSGFKGKLRRLRQALKGAQPGRPPR